MGSAAPCAGLDRAGSFAHTAGRCRCPHRHMPVIAAGAAWQAAWAERVGTAPLCEAELCSWDARRAAEAATGVCVCVCSGVSLFLVQTFLNKTNKH